jgi:hypothetical protein
MRRDDREFERHEFDFERHLPKFKAQGEARKGKSP